MKTDSGMYVSELENKEIEISTSISIKNELQSIDENVYTDIFSKLINRDLNSETSFDIYNFLWPTVIYPFREYGSLLELIVLYRILTSEIIDKNINTICCGELEKRHHLLIKDIADYLNVEVIKTENFEITYKQESKLVSSIKRDLIDITQTLFKQIYTVIMRRSPDPAQTSGTAFFPWPGRKESMDPVIEETTAPYTVINSSFELSSNQCKDVKNTMSVYSYSSTTLIFVEIIYLFNIVRELLTSRNIESGLIEVLNEEYDIAINRTASYAVRHATIGSLENLLWCPVTYMITEKYDYDTVVVGAMGTRDMAILTAADKQKLESFVVPHTIFKDYENIPTSDTTILSPSELGEKSVANKRNESKTPKFVFSGRPYFQSQILDKYARVEIDTQDNQSVMIATQDYPDSIRREFLNISLISLSKWETKSSNSIRVVIKIHPSESKSYYEAVIENMNFQNIEIEISDAKLVYHIARSDVVFTINSNVTIESMIVGTPCILINPWSPLIRPLLFSKNKFGPVPSFKNKETVIKYLNKTSEEDLAEMAQIQRSFARSTYLTEEDSAREIANHID